MKFLADECVDAATIRLLRDAGHDVRAVTETDRGASDEQVLALALVDDRILPTEDMDFGAHAFHHRARLPGVILFRLRSASRRRKWSGLQKAIDRFGDALKGRYVVVTETRLRSRPLHQR